MANAGYKASVVVDEFDLSTFFKEVSVPAETDEIQSTTFKKNSRTRILGLHDGSISAEGFFESGASGSEAILRAALGAAAGQVITYVPQGAEAFPVTALHAAPYVRAKLLSGRETKYDSSQSPEGAIENSMESQADGGVDEGFLVFSATIEGDNATHLGGEFQETAADTLFGAVAHIHVINVGPFSLTSKIQHSSNGTTYVDLITFPVVPANTKAKYRMEIAPGVAIRPWLEASVVTGNSPGNFARVVISWARKAP